MATANFTQSSFLGGEWSPLAQGHHDDPHYSQAMNLSLNGFPVEEGAWTRRPGFVDVGYTHKGLPAIIRTFVAGDVTTNGVNQNVLLELTSDGSNSWLRFWAPDSTTGYPGILCYPAVGTITSFSNANPTVMTMSADQTVSSPTASRWVTGDQVFIKIVTPGAGGNAATVANRQCTITKLTATTFSLADAATGAGIAGALIPSYTTASATAAKIIVEALPYTTFAETQLVRPIQSGTSLLLLSKTKSPWLVVLDNNFVVQNNKDADFQDIDGPYLDPDVGDSQTGNQSATASTADGITYSLTLSTGGVPRHQFTSADVSRAMRLWTQPQAWNSGLTYSTGESVTYNGNFWQTFNNSVTAVPGQFQTVNGVAVFPWILTPSLGRWSHGYITAVGSVDAVTWQHAFEEPDYPLYFIPGDAADAIIDTWQIGKYTASQYPAVGGFLDGRVLLGGAISNHIDASEPNQFDGLGQYYHLFSPTDLNGGVFDDNAINEIYQSIGNNEILWFSPDRQGMIFGTDAGQWLFGAQTTGESLTPTTPSIRLVSRFKAAFIEPQRVGTALLFVQAAGRKVYEYMVDAFSNRFTGRLLNAYAQHLPDQNGGITEIAYQEDPLPCLWACCSSTGVLLGCTYRRYSDFATVPPEFTGWHQHTHGAGRGFKSIAITNITVGQDALAAVTYDPTQTKYHVEVMSRIWGPT